MSNIDLKTFEFGALKGVEFMSERNGVRTDDMYRFTHELGEVEVQLYYHTGLKVAKFKVGFRSFQTGKNPHLAEVKKERFTEAEFNGMSFRKLEDMADKWFMDHFGTTLRARVIDWLYYR